MVPPLAGSSGISQLAVSLCWDWFKPGFISDTAGRAFCFVLQCSFQNSFVITGPPADFIICRMYYFLLYTGLFLSRAGVGLTAILSALRPDRLPLLSTDRGLPCL